MHALRTCDFCDADAVGTFEVVPPELDPTPAERRRTLLCPACRDHLETLIEPLIDRVRSEETADTDGGEPLAAATADGVDAGDDADSCSSDDEGDDECDGTVGTDDVSDDGSVETVGTDDEDDDESVETAGSDDDEEDGEGDADAITAADGTGAVTIDATDEGSTDGSADGRTTTREVPPEHYGTVVRLLRNREFPMSRAGFESLAATAYDLTEAEVERVVDYAIEQGELVQRGSELHRP